MHRPEMLEDDCLDLEDNLGGMADWLMVIRVKCFLETWLMWLWWMRTMMALVIIIKDKGEDGDEDEDDDEDD